MAGVCDECGNRSLVAVERDGASVLECEMCGALAGDDASVARVELAREAHDRGFDPIVYPLVRAVERRLGLRVARASAGTPAQRTWPFVQMHGGDAKVLTAIENLVKSLALAAAGSGGVHWVVEVEYQARLTFTLKPRFHRDPERIDAVMVQAAQHDLQRLCANLERHAHLSWWRS
ncbi:MAG: hypothetical protein R3F56_16005 [Planctomycetota bacterium]